MSDRPIRIAIIGFGAHAVKNIMPCLAVRPDIEIAAIYVRDVAKYACDNTDIASLFTDNLGGIMADKSVSLFYIATPISSHFGYAIQGLEAGKHIWCEKPLTTNLVDTEALIKKARAAELFIGEIMMYQHHNQFSVVKKIISEKNAAGERLISARCRFSIPELDAGNIRYQKDLGGGALLDVGFYPLSSMLGLFGSPISISANGYICPDRGVDLNGDALLHYDGFSAHCTWAIGSAYHNEMELSFSRSTIKILRAYSKPADLETAIETLGNFGQIEQPISILEDDQFANIFDAFVEAVRSGERDIRNEYATSALDNARILQETYDQINNLAVEKPSHAK